MAHEVFRLMSRKIFNKPHLIENESLTDILAYLEGRPDLAISGSPMTKKMAEDRVSVEDGVAYLSVSGPLTYESTGFETICGMTSYQSLVVQAEKAIQLGAKTIIYDLNSPGGEAYGVFETGRQIRKMADENGVNLVAYVDGLAASAGYALAASAHEIISNPQAQVGSIGVVVRLSNSNKAQKEAGMETSYVYAGKSKIPYNEDGSYSEEFIADLQEKVDAMYEEFTSYVAEFRGISQEKVANTEAKTFLAGDALNLGLVDSVLTREEFFTKLAQIKEGKDMPLQMNKPGEKVKMSEDIVTPEASAEDVSNDKLAQMEAKLAEMSAKLEAADKEKAELVEQARQKQIQALADKAVAWAGFGVDAEAYAKSAIDGSVPVALFDAAMEQASSKLEEKEDAVMAAKKEAEDLGEVGAATQETVAEQIDDVEKVLADQGYIKQ